MELWFVELTICDGEDGSRVEEIYDVCTNFKNAVEAARGFVHESMYLLDGWCDEHVHRTSMSFQRDILVHTDEWETTIALHVTDYPTITDRNV